jgi:DNA-binding PadR family transcriptional regulator
MNLSRLMVLGLLASDGPRHGHQVRRDAEQTNVGNWGGVSVGALYRELREMEKAGLVEPIRTEQVGRRPARTIFQITGAGRSELRLLRERAIRELQFGPDAFGVALVFGRTWNRAELIELLRARRQGIAAALEGLNAECAHLEAGGVIGPLDVAMFRRRAMQLDAEMRWHDEFDRAIATLPEPTDQAATKSADSRPVSEPDAPRPDRKGKAKARVPKEGRSPRSALGTGKRRKT